MMTDQEIDRLWSTGEIWKQLQIIPGGDLKPGYYKTRLVKGGPYVAAQLCYGPPLDPETGDPLDRSWRYTVRLNGELQPGCIFSTEQPFASKDDLLIFRIALSEPIGRHEHDYIVKVAQWCRDNAPGLPEANPFRPVDLNQMNSLF